MFNPAVYENSRPDGIGVLEIIDGTWSHAGEPHRFVPLQRTELRGEVAGPLAALHLTQVYGYSREQCDRILEALYRFPLPGDAALTRVRVRFGEVEIRAGLKERRQAEAAYREARQQGQQAALLTREAPNVFTLQVAGIRPDQAVTVETSYIQLARAEGSGWSLRIPLTTAPRYLRSDEVTSRHAQGQPLLLLRDPGHRFSLDLTLQGAGAVESPTHRIAVTGDGDRVHVQLQEGEILPDRDCVISWQPRREPDRPTLQLLLHDDPASAQVYFLALVAPPAVRDPGRSVPREVVLLVDHSGSMEGAKWEAADWAVKRFLSGLREGDAFALGLFHNTTRWLSRAPRPADAGTVEEAIRFLEAHQDSGGTELGVALEQALSLERAEGECARHVLIVTDAQVTDAGRILRLASQESQRPDRRRINVLCIDAAPNDFLARELAERGGGVAKFLTSAPQEEDITTALDEVLADWAEPVRAGLRLEVNRPEVQAAGREVIPAAEAGWSAIDLGDLPAGRAVWVIGRAPRDGGADLDFRLRTARNREVAAGRPDQAVEAGPRPALPALFGAHRVLGLEFLLHAGYAEKALREQLGRLGYDPQEVPGLSPGQALAGRTGEPKVYAENARMEAEAGLRGLLVQEALGYGLACSETAFIAVRTEAGHPVEGRVLVANALPAGWSEEFATPVPSPAVFQRRSSASALTGPSYGDRPLADRPSLKDVPGVLGFSSNQPSKSAFKEFTDRSRRPLGGSGHRTPGTSPAPADRPGAGSTQLFAGLPRFANRELILFDSRREEDTNRLPEGVTLSHLEVRFPDGTPRPESLDPGLSLLLFVADLASPRARVTMADLIRQGGQRPLNLWRQPGQVVQVVLQDPAGTWSGRGGPSSIEVWLGWKPRGI